VRIIGYKIFIEMVIIMNNTGITMEEFKKQWLAGTSRENKLGLFIDSPFCAKLCKFCYFNSTKTSIGSDIYNKYYNEYLPMLFDEYKELLNYKKIDTVYFGGGTSSLMTADIMEKVFSLIPNFKDIKGKVFESHPAFVTEEKVDIWIKNKFTYITFGIQSMIDEVIKKQNRIKLDVEKLAKNIKKLQENGIKVNCDLILFFEEASENEIKDFLYSLNRVVDELNPDLITIYPNIHLLPMKLTNKDDEVVPIIKKFKREFLKFNRRNKVYKIMGDKLEINNVEIGENLINNYFCTKLTIDEFYNMRVYDSSSFPFQNKNQDILGIGGYGERRTYSYNGSGNYYEIYNNDWKPEIFLTEE